MKKIFILFAVCLLAFSCKTYSDYVHGLRIGMSKESAMLIMGKNYRIDKMAQEVDGILEVFRFPSDPNAYPAYFISFKNDVLVEVRDDRKPYVPTQEITVKHKED